MDRHRLSYICHFFFNRLSSVASPSFFARHCSTRARLPFISRLRSFSGLSSPRRFSGLRGSHRTSRSRLRHLGDILAQQVLWIGIGYLTFSISFLTSSPPSPVFRFLRGAAAPELGFRLSAAFVASPASAVFAAVTESPDFAFALLPTLEIF